MRGPRKPAFRGQRRPGRDRAPTCRGSAARSWLALLFRAGELLEEGARLLVLAEAADATLERIAPGDGAQVMAVHQLEVADLVQALRHFPAVLLSAHPDRRVEAPQVVGNGVL